ncbi:unnamed protein product [Ectocarpus sp. CCAP 1310/34]|nr:unnamed protein product [Ectocarpus sp. CCAP 1310/34]
MSEAGAGARPVGPIAGREAVVHQCAHCGTEFTVRRKRDRCRCCWNPFGNLSAVATPPHAAATTTPAAISGQSAAGCSLHAMRGPGRDPTLEAQESEGDDMPDSAQEVGAGGLESADNGSGEGDDFGGGDEFGGAEDGSASGGAHEETGGARGLGNLMGRVEEVERTVESSGRDTDAGDEYSMEDGGGVEGDDGLNDEGYDDFQGDIDYEGGPVEPEVFLLPEDGGGTSSAIPRLEVLHTMAPSFASSTTVEGGPEKLRYNTKAAGSPFYPFATKEQQLMFIWIHVHRIPQRAFGGLLEILDGA